ncbi:hypothetical protein HDV62DRAFT_151800 [Trichoderma sp. SZMC 28011]
MPRLYTYENVPLLIYPKNGVNNLNDERSFTVTNVQYRRSGSSPKGPLAGYRAKRRCWIALSESVEICCQRAKKIWEPVEGIGGRRKRSWDSGG